MNYIKHLTGFFHKSNADTEISPIHICLYITLFQRWNLNRFKNPILINREEIMKLAKIKSKATYHKCMKELHQKNYIIYKPSYSPYEGTEVSFVDLTIVRQENENTSSFNEQTTLENEPVKEVASSKNKRTRLKNERSELNFEQVHLINNNKTFKKHFKTGEQTQSKKSNEKNEVQNLDKGIPENEAEVIAYFQTIGGTQIDAQKFYNHFESNGWLVAGKTKMKKWQAAARNWMLRNQTASSTYTQKSNSAPKPNHLQTPNDKNYAEPL